MFNDPIFILLIFGAGVAFTIVVIAAYRLWSYVKDLEAIAARKEHTLPTKRAAEDMAATAAVLRIRAKGLKDEIESIATDAAIISQMAGEVHEGPYAYDSDKSLSDREQETKSNG